MRAALSACVHVSPLMHVCLCTCMCACVCTCVCPSMCVCVCVCVCVCAYRPGWAAAGGTHGGGFDAELAVPTRQGVLDDGEEARVGVGGVDLQHDGAQHRVLRQRRLHARARPETHTHPEALWKL